MPTTIELHTFPGEYFPVVVNKVIERAGLKPRVWVAIPGAPWGCHVRRSTSFTAMIDLFAKGLDGQPTDTKGVLDGDASVDGAIIRHPGVMEGYWLSDLAVVFDWESLKITQPGTYCFRVMVVGQKEHEDPKAVCDTVSEWFEALYDTTSAAE
ncbi:hypothetical protein VTJ49DRAFT_2531 [Mycothermus thermophilus]|uniref:Uncharacterized protein n=1 Tax=Humicola insolens TaxID=85995 RepID=A0ABR3VBI7_HUMIN